MNGVPSSGIVIVIRLMCFFLNLHFNTLALSNDEKINSLKEFTFSSILNLQDILVQLGKTAIFTETCCSDPGQHPTSLVI